MSQKTAYKYPCFVACSQCEKQCVEHGTIIFEDGSQSKLITSIEGGKMILKELVAIGKLSARNSERIEDQLLCSDLVLTQHEALVLTAFNDACETVEEIFRAERAMWN